jgi:methionyl-tRNA formyltransferase
VRVVFAGTPAAAVPSLDRLLAHERHDVAAVVTRPDRPAGRGRTLTASPVRARAEAAGLEVLTPAKASDPDFLDRLRALAPECCPVVAYGALLKPDALAVPNHGWVNLHFSVLPAWRGAAPVQHALLAGDDLTGASTFRIEEGLDTGPVYGTLTTPIGPRETTGDLLARLAVAGAELLVATLDGIEDGTVEPQRQADDGVSHAPKITVDDARIDWSAPALRVDRLVRACTPDPGAWTTFRDRRVKLGPVLPLGPDDEIAAIAPETARPGEIAVGSSDEMLVATGSAWVQLGEVRPEGKSGMDAGAWARGVRPRPGDAFV